MRLFVLALLLVRIQKPGECTVGKILVNAANRVDHHSSTQ
jgi:hypothetical protein